MRWRWFGFLFLLGLAARVGHADDAVRQALAEIRSPNALVRCQAASTLAGASSPDERAQALGALRGALQDGVASVRQAAATALGRLGDVRALPWVEARLTCERSPSALAALLLAVGSLGDARHAP